MSEFWYTLINPGCEDLLKEEIKLFYPEYKFAYSAPGFVTFKNESDHKISQLYFAHDWGICSKPTGSEKLPLFVPEHPTTMPSQKKYLVKTKNNTWLCTSHKKKFLLPHLGQIEVHEEKAVPSRAYFKLKEAMSATEVSFKKIKKALDLGASPGGASFYLLENNVEVLGIDPGEMDPVCLKNKKFKHLKLSLQHIDLAKLTDKYDLVTCDINLSGAEVYSKLLPLIEAIKPKYLFWTIKINKLVEIKKLETFRKELKKKYKTVVFISLPSHKKETLLFCE